VARTVSSDDINHLGNHMAKRPNAFHRCLSDSQLISRGFQTCKYRQTINEEMESLVAFDFEATEENDDADDVWCNPEDEDNWKQCLEVDRQRKTRLLEILGDQTLRIIREQSQVRRIFRSAIQGT
jgi:hypothetical protein